MCSKVVSKVVCELCGREISRSNYSKHLRRHENHPETFEPAKYALQHEGLECQFCGKLCKNRNSLCNHERLCKSNPDRQNSDYIALNREGFNNIGRIPWNKGLNKHNCELYRKRSKELKDLIAKNGHYYCMGLKGDANPSKRPEVREKISLSMSDKCSNTNNWTLRGWYDGIWCDSSWELAFILYCKDHKILFERNKQRFPYMWEGCTHWYTPDFYLPDQEVFVEVKGYVDSKSLAKLDQFAENIIMYDHEKMTPILEYVVSKYGENYWDGILTK